MVPLHLTLSIACMAGTSKGRGRGGGEKRIKGEKEQRFLLLSL